MLIEENQTISETNFVVERMFSVSLVSGIWILYRRVIIKEN